MARPIPELERFWAKVSQQPNGCWEWTGARSKAGCGHVGGYGFFHLYRGPMVKAHRFAYELLVAPIPPGLDIDHLCANRGCVNPAHLEPVSRSENIRRMRQRRSA